MSALSLAPITMSSREIAELTGKEHKNVKRDIEKMLADLEEDALKFEHIYRDSMNREQTEYRLDRELTENLLLGYSATLRRKVLARLRELEGILADPAKALVVTIWCDSQYVVNGCNDWLAKWKVNGWNRRPLNSPKRAEGEIKNLDLWKAIDAALSANSAVRFDIRWCKGHIGIAGNERADELAEQGRQAACEQDDQDLDERYRQIMGAA